MYYKAIFKTIEGDNFEEDMNSLNPPIKLIKSYKANPYDDRLTLASFKLTETKCAKLSGNIEYVIYEETWT